jgi:hypothetical protein
VKPFLHRLQARREIAALFFNIAKDIFFFVNLQIGDGRGTAPLRSGKRKHRGR